MSNKKAARPQSSRLVLDRREFVRRAGALGISLSGAGALLAGCGGDEGTASGGSPASKAHAPAGGTLKIGPVWNPESLDPATSRSGSHAWHSDGVLQGLLRYVPGSEWQSEPSLAETFETSSDGQRLVFDLRRGVPFHGGYGEVTAEDVRYSIERAAGRVKLYPDAKKDETPYYAQQWDALDRVKLTGKYSGEIRLKRPSAVVGTITLPYSASGLVIPKAAVERLGRKFATQPIGTGPYEVAEWEPAKQLILRRFAEYGGPEHAPYEWDEIHYLFSQDAEGGTQSTPTVLLEAGEVDVTALISPRDYERLQDAENIETLTSTTLSHLTLQLNVQHPNLRDERVREAIRYGVDVPALIAIADGDPEQRMDAIVGPAYGIGVWEDAPRYERDVARAKDLLSEAGVSGLKVQLHVNGKPEGEVIQSNLAEIGIDVELVVAEPPDDWYTSPKVAQMTFIQYSGAPDPHYPLSSFTCEAIGAENFAFWCNDEYSELQKQLEAELDEAARTEIAVRMQQLMDESKGFVFGYNPRYYYAHRSGLELATNPSGEPYPAQFRSV